MKNDAKETAAMSVSADGRPCVPPDTNVNEYEHQFMCSSTPLRSHVNQLATSISPEPGKSKKKVRGFFLPNNIFDYGLTPGAFCVYCYLCRCRNAKDGNICFPSYKTIAAACGISKRSVSNALRQLEAGALIYRRNRFAGRRQTSNLYYLPDAQPLLGERVMIACSPVPDLPGGKVSGACQEQYEINNTNEEHPSFNKELSRILEYAELNSVTDPYMRETMERLGRHRTQTALFIDYLRENNVRVLSVTENIDTGDENDDLLVGFKGLMNDYYARDGGRKVRTGYRQKQKEGLIMTPPFGYFKDKNTKEVVIVEEAAEIVRLIFKLYVDGHGFKAVARILNEKGCQTPAYFQKKLLNKNVPCTWPSISKQGIWINTTVKRILKDEIYTGTLINHKSETNNINKTFKFTTPEEQYRHENFVPPIISRELWEQAQFLIKDRPERNVRSKADQKIHRYTGLIFCRTCGSRFTARNRKWKDATYVEYICTSYHRYGKEYCSPHLIREETLDKLIYEELESIKWMAQENWKNIERQVRDWASQKGNVERKVAGLTDKIAGLESEIEQILMERIHDKANAERYNKMIEKRELEITQSRERIENYQNIEVTVQKRKAGMKHSIDLLDEIVANGGISDTHLRMLIDGVYVDEIDGKLEIEICLKADFMPHYDEYNELGELVEKYSDLGFSAGKYNRTMYAKGEYLVKREAV